MKLSITKDDGQIVQVAVDGPMSQRELNPADEPLTRLLGPNAYGRHVRLDLSGTNYLDSSGVGWLLTCHKRMRQAGGRLALCAPQAPVANVLKLLKLEGTLQIEQSAGSAAAEDHRHDK